MAGVDTTLKWEVQKQTAQCGEYLFKITKINDEYDLDVYDRTQLVKFSGSHPSLESAQRKAEITLKSLRMRKATIK